MSNKKNNTKVYTVNNIQEAHTKIAEIIQEGYSKETIYVLTHDKKRTEQISERTETNEIGFAEEGLVTAVGNLFRSDGDELRAKLRSMGVSNEHAEQLEKEMDKGKIVILAWSGTAYDDNGYDKEISFYPSNIYMPIV
jgi:hypothetical protein